MFQICDGILGDGCHSALQDFISAHSSQSRTSILCGRPRVAPVSHFIVFAILSPLRNNPPRHATVIFTIFQPLCSKCISQITLLLFAGPYYTSVEVLIGFFLVSISSTDYSPLKLQATFSNIMHNTLSFWNFSYAQMCFKILKNRKQQNRCDSNCLKYYTIHRTKYIYLSPVQSRLFW